MLVNNKQGDDRGAANLSDLSETALQISVFLCKDSTFFLRLLDDLGIRSHFTLEQADFLICIGICYRSLSDTGRRPAKGEPTS